MTKRSRWSWRLAVFRTFVYYWNWLKLAPVSFELWLEESYGLYIGLTPVYKVPKGSSGTKNGFPMILEEDKYFRKRFKQTIFRPNKRHGYRDGVSLYAFDVDCVEHHGRLIRIWGIEKWLD